MKCPKCSYERKATDSAPAYECPSCGIIYAKYQPGGVAPSRHPSRLSSNAESSTNLSRPPKTQIPVWVIPAVIGLVIGYFAGREHIKYELRQTFQAAAEGIKSSLNSALPGNDVSSGAEKKGTPKSIPEEPAPFSVTLDKKGYQAADFSAGIEDAITFAVTFNNLTGKDIRAFDGSLTFTDLLDNTLLSAKLAINDPVASSSQLNWSGQIDYNQFIDRHQRLRNEDFQNLKIRFETKKILFSDGSMKEFE